MYHGDIFLGSSKFKRLLMSRWSPKTATREITKIATSKKMTISYCLHAKERLAERNIIISDVLHVLRYGIVQQDPQPSTREAFNKYLVESKSPNSENRTIGVVVIPDSKACFL